MQHRSIHFGLPALPEGRASAAGRLISLRGQTCYRIDEYDKLEPFLVSVISDSDLWMYVSSGGGLTAGRRDADHSLFPYETVDKLHTAHTHTGSQTIIRVVGSDGVFVWQPFADDGRYRYEINRSLHKHVLGCGLWFEEKNLSLGLTFRYGWRPSERYGWVRTSELINDGAVDTRVEILDGVRNLLPAEVEKGLQDTLSCLVDAYKSAECDPETKLAVYRLSANIVDRAEASEALLSTVAWQSGLPESVPILNGSYCNEFVLGQDPPADTKFNGRRCSYLLKADSAIAAGAMRSWHLVLDTPVDQAGVVQLRQSMTDATSSEVEEDIARGYEHLRGLLGTADALQCTGDPLADTHHVANVLYNIARGGVLPDQYQVDRNDLADFLATRNRPTAQQHAAWVNALPDKIALMDLHTRAGETGDINLLRLCTEYLPIVFSRRHGDPSRPWNRFSILMKNPDGSPLYAYQGNWRDIFQNWEALCRSFPECLEPVIAKFVNASTMDGFNPYRVTNQGIDWETPEPGDPWSSIGYWGDHQAVYLTKLLEASLAHHPERLTAMLGEQRFCYADVPYDIKPFADIIRNAQDTIDFNQQRQRSSDARVTSTGTDGRLVHENGSVLHVSLAEKLIVPILAKISNLVPEGGIWMNTMRPEWNDANNALVGNGMSVVTACYLYRHLGIGVDLFAASGMKSMKVSSRVADWIAATTRAIEEYPDVPLNDSTRRDFLDAVGVAFSEYRADVYSDGPGKKTVVKTETIINMLRRARTIVAETIETNRRPDGLYHAYNILHIADGTATISRLPLMLEGQVAALSSGLVSPDDALGLLEALRASDLYREDQHSYLLYPEKTLPGYLEKNRVSDAILERSPTLATLVESGDNRVVIRDAEGQLRFHPDFHNANALRAVLGNEFPEEEIKAILDTYEEVFDHKSFTGRSGTMYGYEGIGCIYWHMIAKLLLAVQEIFERSAATQESSVVTSKLREHYYDIRAGLGFMKSPEEFGAFPLDPYSHTPGFGGARQPGMTGQVKEEILTRFGELGVSVENGEIRFGPQLLRDSEFIDSPTEFAYIDTAGSPSSIPLEAGSLAFTLCQIPVVYTRTKHSRIGVLWEDGSERRLDGSLLPAGIAEEVFGRTGRVTQITVHFPPRSATG